VTAGVPQRLGVPHFNGTDRRHSGIVRVGAVQHARANDAAVEMDERLASFAFPSGQAFARFLVVLGKDVRECWSRLSGSRA
jgi:hypothetical protein